MHTLRERIAFAQPGRKVLRQHLDHGRFEGQPRITDEGHRILDIRSPEQRDIAEVVAEIRQLAGVVETGFFPTEATEALIATSDGVRRMTR